MTNPMTRRAFAAGALLTAAGATKLAAQARPEWLSRLTPPQQLGPFYPVSRMGEADADLTRLDGHDARAAGEVIEVFGRVLDRMGNPISNAKVELWQANTHGRYAHANDGNNEAPLDPHFQGFADLRTDRDGEWRIITVRPGLYGRRPRHIHFDVQGLHTRLITQMYFPEEEGRKENDRGITRLGDGAAKLIAHKTDQAAYHWDIVLADP